MSGATTVLGIAFDSAAQYFESHGLANASAILGVLSSQIEEADAALEANPTLEVAAVTAGLFAAAALGPTASAAAMTETIAGVIAPVVGAASTQVATVVTNYLIGTGAANLYIAAQNTLNSIVTNLGGVLTSISVSSSSNLPPSNSSSNPNLIVAAAPDSFGNTPELLVNLPVPSQDSGSTSVVTANNSAFAPGAPSVSTNEYTGSTITFSEDGEQYSAIVTSVVPSLIVPGGFFYDFDKITPNNNPTGNIFGMGGVDQSLVTSITTPQSYTSEVLESQITDNSNGSQTTQNFGSNGSVQYTETDNTSSSGQVSAAITGSGDDTDLSDASISLASGASAAVDGADNAITLAANAALTVGAGATGNTVTDTGNGSTITDNGSGNTLSLNDVTGVTVNASSDTVNLNSGTASSTVFGNGNTVDGNASGVVFGVLGTGNTINAGSDTVYLDSGTTSSTVFGNGNTVVGNASGVVFGVLGTSNTIDAGSDTVYLDSGTTSSTVFGNSNTVVGNASGLVFGVLGTGNTIDAASDTVYLDSGTSSSTVFGNNNTVVGNASGIVFGVEGTGDTIDAGNDTVYVDAGTTSSTVIGNDNTIDGNASGVVFGVLGTGNTIDAASDTVYLDAGTNSSTVFGNNNTVVGNASGVVFGVEGTGDTIDAGNDTVYVDAGTTGSTVIGNDNTIDAAAETYTGIGGTGNVFDASNATMYLNNGASGTQLDGTGDTINVLTSGNSFTVGSSGITVTNAQGTEVTTNSAGDALNLTNVSDAAATSTTTISGTHETVNFGSSESVTLAQGTQENITGTDGTLIAEDDASNNGLISNMLNWAAGGSAEQLFTNLASGVSFESNSYSGANATGALQSTLWNYTNATSGEETYNPDSQTSDEFSAFNGLSGTGTNTYNVINYTNDTSQYQQLTGLGSGVIENLVGYQDPSATGAERYGIQDNSNDTSLVDILDPASGIDNVDQSFGDLNGTGDLHSESIYNSNGTSMDITYDYGGNPADIYTTFYQGSSELGYGVYDSSGDFAGTYNGLGGEFDEDEDTAENTDDFDSYTGDDDDDNGDDDDGMAAGGGGRFGNPGTTISASNTSIALSDNETATLTGSGNNVTVGNGDTVTMSDSGTNTVTLAGDNSSLSDIGTGDSYSVSGQNNTLNVSNAAITVAGGVTLDMDGNTSTMTINGNTNVTLGADSYLVTATVSGNSSTLTDMGFGNTLAVTGASDTVDVSAAGNSGDSLQGNIATFSSGTEQFQLGTETVTVASGVATTIVGSDGTMAVDNDADGTVQNVVNWNVGGSETETFTQSGSTLTEDDKGYAGSDGSGTQLYEQQTTSNDGTFTSTISGQGAVSSLSNATITLSSDASAMLNGDGDTVTLGDSSALTTGFSSFSNTITLSGTNASLNDGGTGDDITLSGSSATALFTGSASNGSVALAGSDERAEFTGSSNDAVFFGAGTDNALVLDVAPGFAGTVAGLTGDDAIDLGDFLFSGSPTISGVTGTGATGTSTTITITDGATSTQIALLNQFSNQYAVSASAYTLAADGTGSSAGTLLQLAAGH